MRVQKMAKLDLELVQQIQNLGNIHNLKGSFLVDWGFEQIEESHTRMLDCLVNAYKLIECDDIPAAKELLADEINEYGLL